MAHVRELPHAPAVPQPSEHALTLRDGTELFYRAWLPEKPTTEALLLFHRGHEHSGRWQETVAALGLADVAVFAWDQRGHGRSPGERGAAPDEVVVAIVADRIDQPDAKREWRGGRHEQQPLRGSRGLLEGSLGGRRLCHRGVRRVLPVNVDPSLRRTAMAHRRFAQQGAHQRPAFG